MKKEYHYYFTTEKGKRACSDFVGTYEKCEAYAQRISDILGENIYIYIKEDIVGIVYPEEYL